jgi:hypothetical protein
MARPPGACLASPPARASDVGWNASPREPPLEKEEALMSIRNSEKVAGRHDRKPTELDLHCFNKMMRLFLSVLVAIQLALFAQGAAWNETVGAATTGACEDQSSESKCMSTVTADAHKCSWCKSAAVGGESARHLGATKSLARVAFIFFFLLMGECVFLLHCLHSQIYVYTFYAYSYFSLQDPASMRLMRRVCLHLFFSASIRQLC